MSCSIVFLFSQNMFILQFSFSYHNDHKEHRLGAGETENAIYILLSEQLSNFS